MTCAGAADHADVSVPHVCDERLVGLDEVRMSEVAEGGTGLADT